MFLVYPTDFWFSAEHVIRIVDDRDTLQYGAADVYDALRWLIDHGESEFVAPSDGELHVITVEVVGVFQKGAKSAGVVPKPDSDDVARAFLQRFGRDRLDTITRYWNPVHAFVSFDAAPGDDPFQFERGQH